ncbi:MAG: L-histidine N(alpha)-methyltransferase [Gemmatimonadota bacterium]
MNPITAQPASAFVSASVAVLSDVMEGLSRPQKQLPCKLFYDEAGARLFERICTLPEYYPTRTEIAILRGHAGAVVEWIGPRARIVEFGSGSGEKTRILLRALRQPSEYIPIDISNTQLLAFARSLAHELPWIRISPMCDDYTNRLLLPATEERTIVFFPGSTIGNFEPAAAFEFLRNAAALAGRNGGLLIGVDLRKERSALERAYNDAQGVTAEFNRNILRHVNRACDADFRLDCFGHHAFYDEAHGRIEMHLVSTRPQNITLARSSRRPRRVGIGAGESILTEYSYKYDIEGFRALARSAGFAPVSVWTDPARRFSVHAFEVA